MDDTDRKDEPNGPVPPDGPAGRGDPIETVIRLTGPRPAVPRERADRVREAVHAHWQGVVETRAARRRLWTGGLVLTAAAAAVLVAVVGRGLGVRPGGGAPAGAPTVGLVEAADGLVHVGTEADVGPGSLVRVGSELSTEGAEGRLAIRMTSGHSVRLNAGTRLRILSATRVALDRGVVYVDSRSLGGATGDPLAIETPLGTILERGTQYEVRTLEDRVRLRVREGSVSLEHRGVGAFEVAAGHEVEIDAGGRALESELTTFDQGWEWIGPITPMMKIEGRSAREFLDWAARERGLRVRFASSDMEAAASRIRLSGSIEGMTLDEALEAVLPASGLAHRIDQGVLWVQPAARDHVRPGEASTLPPAQPGGDRRGA